MKQHSYKQLPALTHDKVARLEAQLAEVPAAMNQYAEAEAVEFGEWVLKECWSEYDHDKQCYIWGYQGKTYTTAELYKIFKKGKRI